jgi:hypothetical protein
MLGHVGVQDVIGYILAHATVLLRCELRQDIAVLVFYHEEKGGRMMILEDCEIIVKGSQLRVSLRLKYVVVSGVIHVMCSG